MSSRATGTFEVKLNPLSSDVTPDEPHLGRMSIDKQFSGELEGTSVGQMLTAMTDVKGSAGYVAIEKVTGSLQGKKGSFVLQHNGSMGGGEECLSITVVPDSGTDELTGLSGTMTINRGEEGHSYEFEYSI